MQRWKQRLEEIFLHFDDELGVFSALGSGLAGAGLLGVLAQQVFKPASPSFLSLLAGLALIGLDYFR